MTSFLGYLGNLKLGDEIKTLLNECG